ncbi:MAG: DUF3502 domain-containing protein [Acetatifactor sp.]|nr:DUF3502 domain-containing protein [Acetatifactor sp.]
MKNGKKLLALLLAGSMTLSLAACGSSAPAESDNASTDTAATETAATDEAATETASTGLDTSERVDLVFYVMGDAPADEAVVEDALNEKLLERFNATVDFQFSTWTDFQQKYSLELTSGGADLIYVANWLNFKQLAKDGAFLELNDLLDNYGQDLKALIGDDQLNACSVNGQIYAIPNCWPEYVSSGIKYREDLRAAYDLPVPDSLENVEAYLSGIKENLPDQGLLTSTTEESTGLQVAFDAAWLLNLKYSSVTTNGLPYGLNALYDSPSDVYDYWFSDDFVEDCKLMKKWADMGFWSRSALSDTNDSEAFTNGLCVMEPQGQNPSKYITSVSTFADAGQGWEAAYIAYGEVNGVIYPGHATQNGTSIVRGSKNPERAMAVLQAFMTDKELNELVQCGIEGTHYTINDEGFYETITDDTGAAAFGYEGFSTWNLRNTEYKLISKNDALLQEIFNKYQALGEKTKFPNIDIYSGFAEDYSGYDAERTAVSNVMRQYLAPLQAGLVSDVDAAVEEFRTKATEAGLEKVREGFKAQWIAYCDEYGYK